MNYSPGWRQYIKMSDVVCPPPVDAFVFAEEHPGSINDGYLEMKCDSPDLPSPCTRAVDHTGGREAGAVRGDAGGASCMHCDAGYGFA